MKRLSIDTGGTFTDLIVVDEGGELRQFKAPTTPAGLEIGVLDVIGKAARADGQTISQFLATVDLIVHGTTQATNALLTRQGAPTGLITNEGFRDVIEIRRGTKSATKSIYNQVLAPYRPLVPRYLRRGVPGRILHDGSEHEALDEDAVRAAATFMGERKIESVAIGFLHAYANPAHEQRAAEICREVLPDVYVTMSHEVLPVWREFERFSTTVVSAYVGPIVARSLTSLDRRLSEEGFQGTFLLVTASGVVQSASASVGHAVQLLGSGPAAMPAAAIHVGLGLRQPNLLSVDMGGTSFDVCLIVDGQVPTTTESWFGEERVAIKTVDVQSVGAGGGSIASLDPLGMLQVGPRSAGADPGPACYGRGNEEPTVTDANVILGYVPTDYFLGGDMQLDRGLAEQAVTRLGSRLGLGVIDTASAIVATVNARMADRIHESCSRRGFDVRDFALVAGGGAGPVHGAFLARMLGIRRVIVPPTAGLLSAFGMQVMELGRDYARAYISRAGSVDSGAIDRLYEEMTSEAVEALARSGVSREEVRFERSLEIRYVGQFHEVEVAVPGGPFTADTLEAVLNAFHARHEAVFTFSMPWQDMELLTLRMRATVPATALNVPALPRGSDDASAALKHTRACWFGGQEHRTTVLDGSRLLAGNIVSGPAVIEQPTTSVVIPPGFDCSVDDAGDLVIEISGQPVTSLAPQVERNRDGLISA